MPKDTSGPAGATATTSTTAAPGRTSGYGTRRLAYSYTNTAPPVLRTGPRPSNRPPLPVSSARRKGKEKQTATDDSGEGSIQKNTVDATRETMEDYTGNSDTLTRQESVPPGQTIADPVTLQLRATPEDAEFRIAQTSQQTGLQPSHSPSRSPRAHAPDRTIHSSDVVLCTPVRLTRAVGSTTPALVVFTGRPEWPQLNSDESQLPPFVPNPSLPFGTIGMVSGFEPTSQWPQQSTADSFVFTSNNPLASGGTNNPSPSTQSFPDDVATAIETHIESNQQSAPAPAPRPASTADFTALYSTIMRTLPPTLPLPPPAFSAQEPVSSGAPIRNDNLSEGRRQHLGPHYDPIPSNQATSRSSSVSRSNSVLRDTSGSSSLPPSRSRSISRELSMAPLGSDYSNVQARTRLGGSLSEKSFSLSQLPFIKHMAKRWEFYLIAEDAFPINLLPVERICIAYAEDSLEASCSDYGITSTAWKYVRQKDSGIRNRLQDGLLKIVEETYGVNIGTRDKLTQLIQNWNFVYAGYDIVTKKVNGRFRHPCIAIVLKKLLFTKRSRGHPPGVQFIRELMRDTSIGTSEEPQNQDHRISGGAPLPAIALVCTMILFALQSIKAGDSSNRKAKDSKPLSFSDLKYGSRYRDVLSKLRGYARIDELQKYYMEEIMTAYLVSQSKADNDSDEDLQFDDGMLSDGE